MVEYYQLELEKIMSSQVNKKQLILSKDSFRRIIREEMSGLVTKKDFEKNNALIADSFVQVIGMIKKLSKDMGVMKKDVCVLKEDVRVLKDDVFVLKKDVGVLKEDVSMLKEDVRVLKEDVSMLKEDVGVLKEDVAFLKVDVGILKEEMIKISPKSKTRFSFSV